MSKMNVHRQQLINVLPHVCVPQMFIAERSSRIYKGVLQRTGVVCIAVQCRSVVQLNTQYIGGVPCQTSN